MKKNNFLNRNCQIVAIDAINKYLPKSSFKTAKIKEIKFKFFSNDFVPLSHNLEEFNMLSALTVTALLYLTFGVFPLVSEIKKKNLKKNDNSNKIDSFIFELNISDKNEISNFISKLIVENEFLENNLAFDNLKDIKANKGKKTSYNTKISFAQFFDNQDLISTYNIDCNLNRTFISANFIFESELKFSPTIENILLYKTLWND